jgi:hypothetical protein
MTNLYDIILPKISEATYEAYLTPKDEQRIELETLNNSNISYLPTETITNSSSLQFRKAAEKLAYFFKREFIYDFPGFTATEANSYLSVDLIKPSPRVYLWSHSQIWMNHANYFPITGAVCFRWREWKDAPSAWTLTWAWFHPYLRRKGNLSEMWPYFLARYGNFPVESPYSDAMINFLKKHNHYPYGATRNNTDHRKIK